MLAFHGVLFRHFSSHIHPNHPSRGSVLLMTSWMQHHARNSPWMPHTGPQNQGIQKCTYVSFLLKHEIILKRTSKLPITHWVILARWFREPPLPYLVSGQDEFYLLNISSTQVFFFIPIVTTGDRRRVKGLLSHWNLVIWEIREMIGRQRTQGKCFDKSVAE